MSEPHISIQTEKIATGVTMRIKVQPRQTNGSELFMFWGSVLWAFIGVAGVIQGGDAILMGLLFGGFGFFGLFLSFYNRNKAWRGCDALYRFTCENGVATFARDDFVQTYESAKLERIWFKEYTYYGEPMPLDMLAKYGTSKILVFQILEAKHVYDELREFQGLVNAHLQSGEA